MSWRDRMLRTIKRKLAFKTAALAMAMTFGSSCYATFPDVDSMLQNLRPIAPLTAPQLFYLTLALDAMVPYEPIRDDALLTLTPLADGSLRVVSQVANWQEMSVIGNRLQIMHDQRRGFSSGDQTPQLNNNKQSTELKNNPETVQALDSLGAKNSPTAEESVVDELTQEKRLNPNQPIKGAWIQVLADEVHQSERQELPGYRAHVLGAIIGRDLLVTPQFTFGLAAGYQHGQFDSAGYSGSFSATKRIAGTAYGRYDFECSPLYVLGTFSIGQLHYDNNRKILVPPYAGFGFVNIAHADFTAWEVDAYLEQGFTYRCKQLRIIPKFIAMYSHIDIEGYKEQDAFGLNLNVKYQDMDSLKVGVGAKLDYQNDFDYVTVFPALHAYWFYDFINDGQQATANFLGGGYAFLSQGPKSSPNSIILGGSLNVHSYRNTLVILQYDYMHSTNYNSQGVFIKLRHEWM